jgi:3-hydroxyacyl-CoA dehydrogenase
VSAPRRVGIVGAGLIGRAWAIVFARAGGQVALWDPDPAQATAAIAFAEARLPELHAAGLLADPPADVLARIALSPSLRDCCAGADWVQESGPEQEDAKRTLFAQLDAAAPPAAIIGSSTSAIPASRFTEALAGRARCLVVHPANPPYLLPIAELCPAPWTDPDVVARARTLLSACGMVPAVIRREVPGFALNRLQGGLLAEAFRLVADGVISAEDLDATVRHGLGLRWAFIGPFETMDLNAPGGVADYVAKFGHIYRALQEEQVPRDWDAATVAGIEAELRARRPHWALPDGAVARDRKLMALAALKARLDGS